MRQLHKTPCICDVRPINHRFFRTIHGYLFNCLPMKRPVAVLMQKSCPFATHFFQPLFRPSCLRKCQLVSTL